MYVLHAEVKPIIIMLRRDVLVAKMMRKPGCCFRLCFVAYVCAVRKREIVFTRTNDDPKIPTGIISFLSQPTYPSW